MIGGAVSGAIQSYGGSSLGLFGLEPLGTIFGSGLGCGTRTAITNTLNNFFHRPKNKRKLAKQIAKESMESVAVGTVTSVLTANINAGVDYANGHNFNRNLYRQYTSGFGEVLKNVFSVVDDALTYIY